MVFHLTISVFTTYEPIKRDFNKHLWSSMRYGFPKNPIVKKPSQTNSKDKKSLHIQQVFLHWFKKCKMTNMHTTSSMDFRQSKCEVGASWLWRVMAWSHSNKQTNKQTSILIYRLIINHFFIFLILININCSPAYLQGQFFLPML